MMGIARRNKCRLCLLFEYQERIKDSKTKKIYGIAIDALFEWLCRGTNMYSALKMCCSDVHRDALRILIDNKKELIVNTFEGRISSIQALGDRALEIEEQISELRKEHRIIRSKQSQQRRRVIENPPKFYMKRSDPADIEQRIRDNRNGIK